MKNIREIITDLNVARSNSCSKEKSEEIKGIIQNLLPYAEIEEELGIDLITLFKALKNGCYVKPWAEIKHSYEIRTGSDNIHLFLLDENNNDYSLKDYGKTWALKKEELLCQK